MSSRVFASLIIVVLAATVLNYVVRSGSLPPADFTFNNNTEVESLDPAVVTGQPEGRILWSIYEGLVSLGPKDRKPLPGVAERWEISEDQLTYTFHLRRDATWSNGDPVTAHDFVYSMRRFLDPMTLAEYAYQAWYLKNAKRYSRAARAVEPGDQVEIELHSLSEGSLPFARGQLVRGLLDRIEDDPEASEDELSNADEYTKHRTFVVIVDGNERHFRITDQEESLEKAEACKQLLLDFEEVGIRAIDDYTVETVLESPTAYWLELLGFYPLSPVNKTCVETYGTPAWTRPENIVTNGPYRIVFRRLRDRIRLEKRDDYWDADNVSIRTIDALAVESVTTEFNLYETGKIDWVPKLASLMSKEILKTDPPRDDFNPGTQFGTYFYSFNTTRKPLDDPRVRQALVMAIDRAEILRTVGAGEEPSRSFCPPGIQGYESPLCPEENIEAAQKLLAEAGYPDGEGFPKIDILYNYQEDHQAIAELIRKQWQRGLGINVATRNEEWGTYLSSQRQLNYDVIRRAWVGDYLDPNTFLDMFVTGGENNNTGWSNTEYDQLIESAQSELDSEKRLAILREAEVILMKEGPLLPLFFYVSRNLVRPRIQGFWNNLQDAHPLKYLRIDPEASMPNDFMSTSPRYASEGEQEVAP